MRKHLSVILAILLLWGSSCDPEALIVSQTSDQKKITLTDVDHDSVAKDLLSKLQKKAANGRVSSIEVTDAFFKYSDPDSGILNYTFRLPDHSPDYFENLVLSQYEDGFYGFIYRYIPDGEYISDKSFKGVLQLYNLDNELIQAFPIPYVRDSIAANGRIQLINQCVRNVEQTCVTTYEIETVTDYPCHCQYDRKVETGTVCTFSLNMGWCDDMTAAPPAGGGGTYIGPSDAIPHSGGPGGVSLPSIPKPVKNPVVMIADDDITFNNVKSPCLVNVIKNLMKENFKNKINKHVKHLFVDAEQVQNLDFTEVKMIVNSQNQPVHARTMPPTGDGNSQMHIEIRLNASTLPGTSHLFQIVAIYHETVHSFLMMDREFASYDQNTQHKMMGDTIHIQLMISAVQDIYGRALTKEESKTVAAVWLYNLDEGLNGNSFIESLTQWGLTIDDIVRMGAKEENLIKDNDTGKIKSIGGSDCY
ncbi:MAG TPA: hypothetical protein VIN08_09035 [Ohtaekwangia sp.]|uniref:hypothetical protein n=1 Tax=Ohtaekwangia sp. TaxID=2066019 RepID=UPI002F93D8D1